MFEGQSFENTIEQEPVKKDQEKVQEKPLEEIPKETQPDQKDKEMEKKEAEVKPEIEEKFQDALGILHAKIQAIQESGNDFPPKDKLKTLIEGISVFAQMQKGAKRMFVDALDRKKEFRSPDPVIFINKGMEALGIIIHTKILHKGGEAWLQERLKTFERETEGIQREVIPEKDKEKEIPKEM